MAKRRYDEPADDLAGTVEGQAREHFEREKAAYEERTGETVNYVPGTPVTRTPIDGDAGVSDAAVYDSGVNQTVAPAEGEGEI